MNNNTDLKHKEIIQSLPISKCENGIVYHNVHEQMPFLFHRALDITSIFMSQRSLIIATCHSIPCGVIASVNHFCKTDTMIHFAT